MKQIKNQKINIIVGMPTYNEANSIANTLRKIDKGLVKYFPQYRSLIVNVDSKSIDGTRSVFLSTATKTEKISFTNGKQPRGKGTNIFLLLKLSKKLGAKYIATIDADITTITEKWPKLLLNPIIQKKADFVAPVYTRNRYEGNTTNHFCFPLLYAWFGKRLAQPIGGDFAMNNLFVDYVLGQRKPKSSFLYGIDIFVSTHAVGANFKIKEVYLGRKIHKPSFDKIVPMFQQVAATMLFVLSQYKKQRDVSKPRTAIESPPRTDYFIRKPDRLKITSLKTYASQNLQKLSAGDILKYLGFNFEEIKFTGKDPNLISKEEWVKILANLLDYIITHFISEKTAEKIAALIAPFFFLRVLAYFEELDKNKSQKNIDKLIFDQAQKLRNYTTISSIDLSKEISYPIYRIKRSFIIKHKGGKNVMEKSKINLEAWQYWYPTKEEMVDVDMPLLGKEFWAHNVSKILDLGCGTGRHAIYFAERGFKVYGFDFAKKAVKKARETAKKKEVNVNFRAWDARRKFPYGDGIFDAVLVVRVIHHYPLKTVARIIQEIGRVLRRKGYFYIQVPTRNRVLKYARMARKEGNPQIVLEEGTYVPAVGPEKGIPHHGFTKKELRHLFNSFEIKKITLRDEHYNFLGVKK